MRASNARAGLRTGKACHRRWIAYVKSQISALASSIRGGSRVPELGPLGSVRGALSNERPYRDLTNVASKACPAPQSSPFCDEYGAPIAPPLRSSHAREAASLDPRVRILHP